METEQFEMIPKFNELMTPVFRAIKSLGGSGKNDEIINRVITDLNLPDDVVDALHNENMTELSYRLTWTKTYMKKFGILDNSERGVWSITPAYTNVDTIDEREIVRKCRTNNNLPENINTVSAEIAPWRKRVAEILQNMNPYSFERLTQRLLRESGFLDVQVTKKSGDGGIDGTGKLRIKGIFSFNVAFQCKRFKGPVGAAEIRDFRGSLGTNIEKGVLITTSSFSRAAKEEAASEGKRLIDLMDGEELINKLAEYGIGLTEVKSYEIDEDFFNSLSEE